MIKDFATVTDRAASTTSWRIRLILALLAALGILASFNTPVAAQVQIREENFDRVGGDYSSFDLNPPAPMTFSQRSRSFRATGAVSERKRSRSRSPERVLAL